MEAREVKIAWCIDTTKQKRIRRSEVALERTGGLFSRCFDDRDDYNDDDDCNSDADDNAHLGHLSEESSILRVFSQAYLHILPPLSEQESSFLRVQMSGKKTYHMF